MRPDPRRTRWALLVTAFAVVAITATLLIGSRPGPAPSSSQIAAGSPTTPPRSPGPTPGATPGATPVEPWEALTLGSITPVASLTPVAADEAGVRTDSAFVLESLTAEPATGLAKRLELAPTTKLRVTAGTDARHATVSPATALVPGAVYRFTLSATDGTPAGSWAFRVRGPLRVQGTLPADRTTGVPVTTGIEVTFDQESVADIAPFFSIEPTVAGRFERHGRTQVFVPSRLDQGTVYTVTIKAGLERAGTDLKLEHDVVFSFETTRESASVPRWIVGRDVLETSPSEAPVIGLIAQDFNLSGEGSPAPTTVDIKVYRYESEAAATAALRAFLAAPRWTQYSAPRLPVAGLPLAVSFTATLTSVPSPYGEGSRDFVIRFPDRLARGWYAVEIAGAVPAYAFLQITRVSAWVTVLTDRTVLWVNDVVAHAPIAGATAGLPGKAAFGTSGADGVLNAPTPAALLPAAVAPAGTAPAAPIVVVRAGRDALLLAFDGASESDLYRGEWWENWYSGDETYWSLMFTDRWQYRATDTVAAWGYLRTREGGDVPGSLEVRIVKNTSTNLLDAPALAAARVEPDTAGVFSLRMPFDRATLGSYMVVAVVGGRVVASTQIEITVIRKPEYRLTSSTDHLAVVVGSKVRITSTATFFDETSVPGLQLRLDSPGAEEPRPLGPTDATGTASAEWVATVGDDDETAESRYLSVSPAGPEAGEIYASAFVLVFPASEQLDSTGVVANGRLKVDARLRAVDLAAVERQLAGGDWNGDPGGRAIAGRSVSVVVTELVPIRTTVGTRYDFIEKVAVPIYRYETERKVLKTTSVSSGADGRLILDLAVPTSSHQYEVRLSTKDPAGRSVRSTITAGTPVRDSWSDAVTFTVPGGQDAGWQPYRIGDPVNWTMRANGKALPSTAPNRYLYVVAQRGIVRVETSDSPTFTRTFQAADAPGVFVIGVRFTGSTYAPKAAAWADFNTAQRRIDVTVTADRDGYRPGEDIGLRVRTVDERGDPVAADIVLQAVDEKLYAMGAAYTPDPLGELYRRVDSGIVRISSTHQVPTASGGEGEGGSGGDGGPRTDFRDMLAFVRLRTNADGLATTTIKASDDLTAWHVAASALTADLRAGVGELLVRVGLPLFASVTTADEYLVTDRPSIRLRAFGLDLRAGDPVVFTVSSPGLGLATTTITSAAFTDAWLSLPALRLGRQAVDVGVVAPNRKDAAGKPLSDRLIASFDVIDSRLTMPRAGYGQVGGQLPVVPASVAATYTFTDAGRARYLAMLEDLVASTSIRLDRGLAASMARSMLGNEFQADPATFPPDTFDPSRYGIYGPQDPSEVGNLDAWERYGIDLMPYGGTDPWLATRIAIADPQSGTASGLRWLLESIRDTTDAPRDLRVAAVAGLASLGEPVFGDIAVLHSQTDLTPFERIHLGLAAAAIGDEATARSIERALATAYGQRLGPWVRLNAATSRDDVAEMTALFALLAARVGDPLAPAMLEYVQSHPSGETSHALEAAATIAALLDRTPASATSFAYTVDGKRTVVELAPGDSLTIALTGPQRASLALERLSGDVGVAATWREPTDFATLILEPGIAIGRVAPETVRADQLVTVNLHATFAAALYSPCYLVVEQVPSGLIPMPGAMIDSDESIIWPSEVVGQQVTFCVWHDYMTNPAGANLRYVARIVSTGTFTWEPALMTIDGVPEVVTVNRGSVVRIGE